MQHDVGTFLPWFRSDIILCTFSSLVSPLIVCQEKEGDDRRGKKKESNFVDLMGRVLEKKGKIAEAKKKNTPAFL